MWPLTLGFLNRPGRFVNEGVSCASAVQPVASAWIIAYVGVCSSQSEHSFHPREDLIHSGDSKDARS